MAADKDSEVRVRVQSSVDIVGARQQGRALAMRAGFINSNLTIIATAISEVARNIVEYAKEGEVIISIINDANKTGVEVVASDQGPGIADVSTVMRRLFDGERIGNRPARRETTDGRVRNCVRSRQRHDRDDEKWVT